MKLKLRLILGIAFLLLFKSAEINAQITPVCFSEKFSNQHNDNKEWNGLLDKACNELNQKKYTEALQTLNTAMAADSIASHGDYTANAYIDVIQRRIKRYLAEVKENVSEQPSITESKIQSEEPTVVKSTLVAEKEIAPTPVVVSEPVKTEKEVTTSKEVETKAEAPPMVETKVEVTQETAPAKEEVVSAKEEILPVKETPSVSEANNVSPISSEKTETVAQPIETPVENNETANSPTKNNGGEIKFTDKDRQDFQDKGMQKVKQLETFVAQIGSKTTPLSLKTQSIASAVKLFDNEEKTVQVSSANNSEKPKMKIRTYLTKLMMLNYSDVKIEWAEFQYASDFIKGLDGNYYGYIIFQQRFNATALDNQKVYSDVTTKKIEIILKMYEKAEQGQVTEQWDVFLGDISVVQTETK